MRRVLFWILLSVLLASSLPAMAATGRVIKVLPHFLDRLGRRSTSPSLFDRDAYQAWLRKRPQARSGVTFDIQWKTHGKAAGAVKVRVEMIGTARGDLPVRRTLEAEVKPGGWFSHWTSLAVTGDDYKELGEINAWRVSLWEGDTLLGEETSFLW
jgi:hypothetical protein